MMIFVHFYEFTKEKKAFLLNHEWLFRNFTSSSGKVLFSIMISRDNCIFVFHFLVATIFYKQLWKLINHLFLKICIDYPFFHCFLGKFTKIHGILSNFEPNKIVKHFSNFWGSGCFY